MVVDRTPLGTLAAPISGDNGESDGVYPLARQPDQLLKVYKPHCATTADANRLDWLISLADQASAEDRAMLTTNSCWPLARVTDGIRPAYGVLLPRAPDRFDTTMVIGERTRPIQLMLDFLVYPPEKCVRHRIPMPTFEQRLRICTDIVAVAAFLERNDAVYGDWSYANAFWCGADHSGYVIDIDGCGYRQRKSVATQNWQEPVPSPTGMADNLTDRYGVALLLARCLTGVRDITPAMDRLRQLAVQHGMTDLYLLVHKGMTTPMRDERPAVGTLLDALRGRATSPVAVLPTNGVAGWRESSVPQQVPAPLPSPYLADPRSAAGNWLLFLTVVALLVLIVVLTS